MKLRTVGAAAGLVALAAFAAAAADAAKADAAGVPAGSAASKSVVEQIKNPVDWFKWGAELRIREEVLSKVYDFSDYTRDDDMYNWFRGRARVWAQFGNFFQQNAKNNDGLSFYGRLTTEPKYVWEQGTIHQGKVGTVNKQAVYDNLYMQWTRIAGVPVSLKFGRFDAFYGRGLLIGDGTPLDGSRTIYSDGAIGTLHLDDMNTNVDFIWLQNDGSLRRLSSIGPTNPADKKNVSEYDTQILGVYVSNKSFKDVEIQAYYLFKDDDPINGYGTYKDDGVPSGLVHTLGANVQGVYGAWDYYGEVAGQWGMRRGMYWSYSPSYGGSWYGDGEKHSRQAYSINGDLGYTFKDVAWTPRVHAFYNNYSGDDNSSATYEGWDPVLGRWPQFSELWAYHMGAEQGLPGLVTNMQRMGLGVAVNPPAVQSVYKAMRLSLDYNYLLANHSQMDPSTGSYERGNMLIGLMEVQFMDCLKGHILLEYLVPGAFYPQGYKNSAFFGRWEITYTF